MNNKRFTKTAFLAIAALLLVAMIASACNTQQPQPGPTATSGAVVAPATNTAVVIVPTATSVPPTETTAPPTATLPPTNTPEPKPVGPDNFPAGVNPLTGLVADPENLNRRPVAVKIQTFPRGQRPPWGISLADIVFDYYQNLGQTRLFAIFYGTDAEQAGPIRSARVPDIHLLNMYKPFFAFGSADQRILERISNNVNNQQFILPGGNTCPPLCRIEPNGPNYLVTNTKDIGAFVASKGIPNQRQNLNGMTFDPKVPEGGTPVEQVFARFNFSSYNRWDYDESTGRYLRFQETRNDENGAGEDYAPFMDRLNDQQVAADNVVILFARHEFIMGTHPGTNEIVDINLEQTWKAYAFRDGMAYELTWNRPAEDSVLYLTFADGSRYPYKPGNTWYQIFGQSSKLEKPDATTWRFTFSIP